MKRIFIASAASVLATVLCAFAWAVLVVGYIAGAVWNATREVAFAWRNFVRLPWQG